MRNRQLDGSPPAPTYDTGYPDRHGADRGVRSSWVFQPVDSTSRLLFTMADPTVNTATSLKILRQTYTKQVFNTAIPRNVDIRDAHFTRNISFRLTPALKRRTRTTNSLMSCFPVHEKRSLTLLRSQTNSKARRCTL
ncbi:MAG TPA: hypothetical protein VF734_17220, partial [Pseudonocardiaceae bacterium]